MIKSLTKTITSTLLCTSLLLFGGNTYAASAPIRDTLPSLIDSLGSSNETVEKYLKVMVELGFGVNPDTTIPFKPDPIPDPTNSTNMTSGLIFLNPSDSNIFASMQLGGAGRGVPWWYDPTIDIPLGQDSRGNATGYPENPTIQAILNSFPELQTYPDPDCMPGSGNNQAGCSEVGYQQKVVNLLMDDSSNIDRQALNQLSISSLVDPLQYDNSTNPQQDAENFIRLISTGMLNIPLDSQYEEARNNAIDGDDTAKKALANYNSQIMGYAARSSIVIDNLYYLLSRRIANPNTQKSVNQVEYDIVQSRIDPNGQWRQDLENQSLAATMRDVAEMIAEQQYQSYLRGQENEALMTSLTALLITQQEFVKLNYYIDLEEDN